MSMGSSQPVGLVTEVRRSQLEPWLDPLSLNINSIDGTYPPGGGSSLSCIIGLYSDSVDQGTPMDFFGGSNSVLHPTVGNLILMV